MKVSLDQFCINVSDLERLTNFYENVLGLEVTHRIEMETVTEVVLAGESGNRIQLAWHHDHKGEIEHGNALWKFYLNTDDCAGLYQRTLEAGCPSVTPPTRLTDWPVTIALVEDPDGYQIEIMETHSA